MRHFTIDELSRSETAARLGIGNTPGDKERANLERLTDAVLDPLREAWGKPIRVNSGYRCPRLNKAVGGVSGSHHLRGMAADLTTGNRVENRRLFQLAMDLKLPYTQLIAENNFSWIHISHDPADVRRQALRT